MERESHFLRRSSLPMTRIRKFLQYLFILTYSIAFGLLLAEFSVRLLDLSKTWTTKKEVRRHEALVEKYFDHAEIGHRYKPGVAFTSILDKPYAINADGFRDIEFATDSGNTLIAFLGASIIEGLGVAVEDRATDIARSKIRSALNSQVNVYNFGIGASSTFDELNILQNHVFKYRPQYVVLQIGFNDLASNWNKRSANSKNQQVVDSGNNDKADFKASIKGFFQNHSALYLYLAEYYNYQSLKGDKINDVLAKVLRDNNEQWDLLFKLIQKFVHLCQQENARPIVMYIPYEAEVIVNADSLGLVTYHIIREFCSSQTIDCINVTTALRDAPNGEMLYFDFTHLTERGNSITGKAITEYFINKLSQ